MVDIYPSISIFTLNTNTLHASIQEIVTMDQKHISTQKNCTQIFITALFIIAKKWKQSKCPSTVEQVNKMCFLHTVDYYSAIKRDETAMHATIWMAFEKCMLSKRSQTQKSTYYMFLCIERSRIGKSTDTRLAVARGWAARTTGSGCSWVRGFPLEWRTC